MKVKEKTIFVCQNCGYRSIRWQGKCPDCLSWNTFEQEQFISSRRLEVDSGKDQEPVLLSQVEYKEESRLKTNIFELDRVLGGGIVLGSVVLIGGDPGIGKSTISLQVSNHLSSAGNKVLYVSAEESVQQTKLRSKRLGSTDNDNLYIVNQTDITKILNYIKKISPQIVVIDSIQVMHHPDIPSSAGSVTQVRECASMLTSLAKLSGICLFIIGHVTKEGNIAGPRVLEHLVDTVLYFEGERYSVYRILRSVKNRFGSTNEIGVFEMSAQGLIEVKNPSRIFLSGKPEESHGSVVVALLEGTRPLLVEIQALVSKSNFTLSRRRSEGMDYNRLLLMIAVMEKRIGLRLFDKDVFINVVGGVKADDPAADLGVSVAIASSLKEKLITSDLLILGEVGLGSEVRRIAYAALRINEAVKLGFKRIILPRINMEELDSKSKKTAELIPVSSVKQALEVALV